MPSLTPSHRFDGDTQVNGTLDAAKFQVAGEPAFAQLAMREQAMNLVLGYYAETFPKNASANSSALATGVLYTTSIGLLAGDLVTNMGVEIVTAGSALTLVKWGLLDKLGNRLAVSADQSGAMVSSGPKTIPMITPYRVLTTDMYYIAALSVGTTGPAVMRTLSLSIDTRVFSSAYGNIATVGSQSDIQATNTLAFSGTVMLQLWTAIN